MQVLHWYTFHQDLSLFSRFADIYTMVGFGVKSVNGCSRDQKQRHPSWLMHHTTHICTRSLTYVLSDKERKCRETLLGLHACYTSLALYFASIAYLQLVILGILTFPQVQVQAVLYSSTKFQTREHTHVQVQEFMTSIKIEANIYNMISFSDCFHCLTNLTRGNCTCLPA